MSKAILIFGSTTGNAETLSEAVAKGLKEGGVDVVVKDVARAAVDELMDYDLIVLGCSTWGDGDLQDDFVDFHDRMGKLSLAGKKAAVFGPGDEEGYPDSFCAAVDILEDKLKESGAQLVTKGLKINGDVELAMDDAHAWGLEIANSL